MTQIDDVKSRLDIVELIAGYVQLQPSGGSFKANCPFHQERTPSFFVFPDRQSWRCFGACADGGDAFSFVMKVERVDFREALHRLGARVGIDIVNRQESGGRPRRLFEINDAARQFFQNALTTPEAEFVRDYLHRRGISDRSLQVFEFGYSPPRDNRLLAHLTGLGYEPGLIAEAGLARETDEGRYYDYFRGRLMIPIRDWEARVAGFGSRALDDSATPKYLNTPRTPVFDKSRILFAMHLAKEPVRQHGAVIVEGYMDAVMAHQHGFDNVVASMGTALTEGQVDLVRRLTKNVIMALDGDPAGQNATLRSLESSWGQFQKRIVQVSHSSSSALTQPPEASAFLVAELPAGQDPDDFIRQSPDKWPAFVTSAKPLFDYLLASLSARTNMDSPEGRAWVIDTMLRFVSQIPDPLVRDGHLENLSQELGVGVETLHRSLPIAVLPSGESRQRQRPTFLADAAAAPLRDESAAEESLLALWLQHGRQLGPHALAMVSPEWFSHSENREIYRSVCAIVETEEPEATATMAPELETHLASLRSWKLMVSNSDKLKQTWQQSALRLEKERLNEEIQQSASVLDAQELDNPDSPVVIRLLDCVNRRGEIDRLLQSTPSRQP